VSFIFDKGNSPTAKGGRIARRSAAENASPGDDEHEGGGPSPPLRDELGSATLKRRRWSLTTY